jgi:predicted metal-dependent enzyme (double-stranded beta helix superfamily)
MATTTKHPAVQAVEDLAQRLGEAEALLRDFQDRFYWIKDHPDFFDEVERFLGRPTPNRKP